MSAYRSILIRATFAAGALLVFVGCTSGAGADAQPPAPEAASTAAPAPPPPAPADPAPPPQPAKDPAPPPPPPEPFDKLRAPSTAEGPPKLPPASPESVRKVKALLARMDSESEEERSAAWTELREMGNLATPALVEVLSGGTPAERRAAVDSLARIKDRAVWAGVRKALSDSDAGVRWRAARAAGEFGDKEACGALAALLKDDKDEDVRRHASYSLAVLGAEEGFAYYKEEIKAPTAARRAQAALVLGKYGKGKYATELAALLKDAEVRVRTAAVRELAELRQKEAIPALILALGDDDYKIRERARAGLERITNQDEFGADKAKWDAWWAKNSGSYKVPDQKKPATDGTTGATQKKADAKPAIEFPELKGEDDFKAKVEGSKGLVLVDFHADWCVWCHRLTPVLNKLARDYQGKVAILGIDADANAGLKDRFGIKGLPTMIVFRDGKQIDTVVGFKKEEDLKAILDRHLAASGKPDAGGAAPKEAK